MVQNSLWKFVHMLMVFHMVQNCMWKLIHMVQNYMWKIIYMEQIYLLI